MLKNKKNMNLKERGITLIALVITIIVLLILAGVAISALTGDSGILNNAEKAKEQTSLANAKEQVGIAVQGALTNAYVNGEQIINEVELKEELDRIIGTRKYEISQGKGPWVVEAGGYKVIISENGKRREPIINAKATTPYLPTGFTHVEGTDLSNGLTITNETGLQNYVWIEVPTTIEEEITIEVEGASITKTVKLSDAANDAEIAAVLEKYAGDYTKGSSTQDYSSWKDEWYDSTGKNASNSSNLDDTAGCGMTYSEYQTTYSKMLNSIKKFGGFWLAQYEAGIAYEEEGKTATHRTDKSLRISNPKSANYAKDQYPYNYIYCSEAQKIANQDSTEEYTSSLPFGIQWDLVCKFLEVKEAKTYDEIATFSKWGNHYDVDWISSANSRWSWWGTTYTKGSTDKVESQYCLLTTGAINTVTHRTIEYPANPMNIYDLAGNVGEYTLEYASIDAPCIYRSGGHYTSGKYSPVASRGGVSVINFESDWGFRSALYE